MPTECTKAFDVIDLLDICSTGKADVSLLDESAEIYAGRAEGEAAALRAFVMVRLAECVPFSHLLPYVQEDLATGMTANRIAAAARVILTYGSITEELRALLNAAKLRVAHQDRIVDLDAFPSRPGMGESVLATLDEVRSLPVDPVIGCCARPAASIDDLKLAKSLQRVSHVELEDQFGKRTTLGKATTGHASFLTFFYTRCTNPLKCSRTVSLLGELDRALHRSGSRRHRVLGVTYDPAFDTSDRLLVFGTDRGVSFSETCRFVRTIGPFEPLLEGLGLGAGYNVVTVNAHRLEWFVAAPSGDTVFSGSRSHWDVKTVIAAMQGQMHP